MDRDNNKNRPRKIRRKSAMGKILDITTIVGGRPKGERKTQSVFGIGIDYALTKAALSKRFKDEFLSNPLNACEKHSIRLKESEKKLLKIIPRSDLEKTINSVFPPDHSRRNFMKSVAASIVAFIVGEAVWLYSGCGGAGPDYPHDYDYWTEDDPPPLISKDIWVNIDGKPSYLHIPASYSSSDVMGLMLCLHASGETCLEMMERFVNLSDTMNFLTLSINWTGNSEEADSLNTRQMVNELKETYGFRIDYSKLYICGYLEGATVALSRAIYFEDGWKGAIGLFGIPDESIRSSTHENHVEKVFIEMASTQNEAREASIYATSLSANGIDAKCEVIEGNPFITPEIARRAVEWVMG